MRALLIAATTACAFAAPMVAHAQTGYCRGYVTGWTGYFQNRNQPIPPLPPCPPNPWGTDINNYQAGVETGISAAQGQGLDFDTASPSGSSPFGRDPFETARQYDREEQQQQRQRQQEERQNQAQASRQRIGTLIRAGRCPEALDLALRVGDLEAAKQVRGICR